MQFDFGHRHTPQVVLCKDNKLKTILQANISLKRDISNTHTPILSTLPRIHSLHLPSLNLKPWRSLVKEDSLASKITSTLNKMLGCFLSKVKKIALQKQPIFLLNGHLACQRLLFNKRAPCIN